MHKKQALRYTKRLDALANDVQKNWKTYGLTKQAAYDFCLQVDQMSDRIDEIAGIDRQSEDMRDEFDAAGEHPAKTDKRDFLDRQEPDEPYMDHYDMDGVLEGLDPEDEYMGEFEHSESAGFQEGPIEGDDPLEGHKRRQRASTGGNWYDKSSSNSRSKSSGNNWYDRSASTSKGGNWYDGQ